MTFQHRAVPAFNQQPRLRFGAGITQQHAPAARLHFRLRLPPPVAARRPVARTASSPARGRSSPVADSASSTAPAWTAACRSAFMMRRICSAHTSPSPGRAVIAENHVPALLAAEVEPVPQHLINHVLVAHRRADHLAAAFADERVQPRVAHHRGDDRFLRQAPLRQHVPRGDRHDVVAVNHRAGFVAQQHAVGVAVVRDADVRLVLAHLAAHLLPDASSRNSC